MEPFIAQIVMFGGNFAPRGWALCDGQLISISQNTALFSILGTIYGGDGRTTFGLPDLRGRSPMHPGNGPGLTPRNLGEKGGQEHVILGADQIPPLDADVKCFSGAGNTNVALGNTWSQDAGNQSGTYNSNPADADMQADTVVVNQNSPNSQVDIVHPFQTVNFIIALEGVYPSRS